MTAKGKAQPRESGIDSVAYGLCCFKCPYCGKLTEFDMHGFDAHGPLGTITKRKKEVEKL
jgi:hypothetical protein